MFSPFVSSPGEVVHHFRIESEGVREVGSRGLILPELEKKALDIKI